MSNVLPIAGANAPSLRLRIGDLAKRSQKTTRAVRLYEEMGLLGPVQRTEGGHRYYTEDVLLRMTWIDKLQHLGFSLTEIRDLLGEWADKKFGPAAMERVRIVFAQKLEDTRVQIKQLEALAEELGHSLTYLDSCEVCDPCTLLDACAECSHPHAVDEQPTLVAGFHPAGAPKGN